LGYIPLSGTEAGSPVTGDIEITNVGTDIKKIYRGDNELYFDSDDMSVGLRSFVGSGIGEIRIGENLAEFSAGNGTYTGAMAVYPDKITVSVTDPASRGLTSDYDFTPNITELDFTQKKYVDDAIAAAGGGVSTVSGTTNEIEVDSTDPANLIVGLQDDVVVANSINVTGDGEVIAKYVYTDVLDVDGNPQSGTNTGDQTSIVGITGTKAQYNTSATDGNFLFDGDISLTTASTSGAATFSANNFNIPRYDTYADSKVQNSLTASTTVAPSTTAVNTALSAKANTYTPLDYSATSTVVGWSSTTTKWIYIIETPNTYHVFWDIDGTSDSATTTFSLPFTSTFAVQTISTRVVNGSGQSGPGYASTAAGSDLVTLRTNGIASNYNASGNKRSAGQMMIPK
jgi:hypothetical protein